MELGPEGGQEPFTKEVLRAHFGVGGNCFVSIAPMAVNAKAFVNTSTMCELRGEIARFEVTR